MILLRSETLQVWWACESGKNSTEDWSCLHWHRAAAVSVVNLLCALWWNSHLIQPSVTCAGWSSPVWAAWPPNWTSSSTIWLRWSLPHRKIGPRCRLLPEFTRWRATASSGTSTSADTSARLPARHTWVQLHVQHPQPVELLHLYLSNHHLCSAEEKLLKP